ncbi:unnamed protein product [Ilex paraguariensis]|uniref:Uncharacterized protein n=1 Tax=Ilex paraguariensis TaxID=185542 RepID=A0ABC8UIF5_9AQUA
MAAAPSALLLSLSSSSMDAPPKIHCPWGVLDIDSTSIPPPPFTLQIPEKFASIVKDDKDSLIPYSTHFQLLLCEDVDLHSDLPETLLVEFQELGFYVNVACKKNPPNPWEIRLRSRLIKGRRIPKMMLWEFLIILNATMRLQAEENSLNPVSLAAELVDSNDNQEFAKVNFQVVEPMVSTPVDNQSLKSWSDIVEEEENNISIVVASLAEFPDYPNVEAKLHYSATAVELGNTEIAWLNQVP